MNLPARPLLFRCAFAAGVLVAGGVGRAAEPGARRELSTDRPDVTESPFTVDAGRLQLEVDASAYTRNRLDGVRTTEWVIAPFNLRCGLTPDTELGVFFTPFVRATEQPRGGVKTVRRGVGDTILRTKMNFHGNDGGPVAAAIIADLKLPTAAAGLGNDQVEGALAFPVAFELGAGWDCGGMTSVAFAHTDAGRRAVWGNTLTFGRELARDTGAYAELTSSAGDGAHVVTFNCGVTRRLNANFQIDCGVNIGLSRTAPDLTVFAGLARRF